MSWSEFQQQVDTALQVVVARARQPAERVARHWEDTSKLTWFGVGADHMHLHASWSFGRLRGVDGPGRATVGVFQVSRATFPDFDDVALRSRLDALVPPASDGPTRVFLHRVLRQLAVGRALLKLAPATELDFFARPDALDTPAATPRWPEHARDRVALALSAMDTAATRDVEALFGSPHDALLKALRQG